MSGDPASELAQISANTHPLRQIAEHLAKISAETTALATARELSRGIKPVRLSYTPVTAAATLLFDPPEQGYAYDLKMITGSLSGADSVAAWIANDPTETLTRLLGYQAQPTGTALQNLFQMTWSSEQGLLRPGEGVVIKTSGSKNITQATLYAISVPAELVARLIW